jgi:hypothetical protein
MSVSWKTVRVLVSSTFRDMHAERGHLVRVVFPELRAALQPHRIELIDIDLRWGVTWVQAEDDRVVDISLQWIDKCRTFFLGILGQRYGCRPLPPQVGAVELSIRTAKVRLIEPQILGCA